MWRLHLFPVDPPGDVVNVIIQVTAVDSVTVTWSPVNKCISYYTVRSVVAVNTTDTSIVYDQLELGKVYSFTITGTDTAGRTGSESEAVTITLDGTLIITSIVYAVTIYYYYNTVPLIDTVTYSILDSNTQYVMLNITWEVCTMENLFLLLSVHYCV